MVELDMYEGCKERNIHWLSLAHISLATSRALPSMLFNASVFLSEGMNPRPHPTWFYIGFKAFPMAIVKVQIGIRT